ncbi:MAG TPA: FHA domain-containing protein [Thermoanaerobaculaceae bacterium]|nr:FHA domain-containing protein [Thermoanaerobaculaceae bacterium]HRS16495.1 FHA domain-containing protein [Thermoanaerobaculaceae bacterium]
MRLRRVLGTVLVVLAVAGGAAAEEGIPLVVAVDSSRSLKPEELAAAASLVRPVLASLPAGTPAGVMEFNDAPRWVVPLPGSPARAAEALGRIVPAGKTTVLLDALVTAARELPAGGVIVLVTDGRDEGSAATMSDLATLLAARQVRIVAAGTGHTVDARALRRLAVLSGGQYLGPVGQVQSAALAGAVGHARTAVERALPPTPAPPPTPVPEIVPTPAPPARSASGPDWLVLGLGAVAVAALVFGVLAWRRKSAAAGPTCPDCGRPMAAWETECSACKIDRLDLRRAEQEAIAAPPAKPMAEEELALDPSVFDKAPLEERLEKTLALSEQIILVVRSPRGPQRSYALNPEHVVAVGRAARVNSITLDDPSVSAQHFKIVPKGEEFYVVDLDSSNGTFVNGERVRVHKLHNGDTIMAGQVECQFRTQLVRTA